MMTSTTPGIFRLHPHPAGSTADCPAFSRRERGQERGIPPAVSPTPSRNWMTGYRQSARSCQRPKNQRPLKIPLEVVVKVVVVLLQFPSSSQQWLETRCIVICGKAFFPDPVYSHETCRKKWRLFRAVWYCSTEILPEMQQHLSSCREAKREQAALVSSWPQQRRRWAQRGGGKHHIWRWCWIRGR